MQRGEMNRLCSGCYPGAVDTEFEQLLAALRERLEKRIAWQDGSRESLGESGREVELHPALLQSLAELENARRELLLEMIAFFEA
jgi:hypothetical protein